MKSGLLCENSKMPQCFDCSNVHLLGRKVINICRHNQADARFLGGGFCLKERKVAKVVWV